MPIFSRVFSGRHDLDEEESRKQIFVLIAVMIGFPFLFTWGIVDFLNDKVITSSLDFAIGTFLFANLFLLKVIKRSIFIYRIDLLLLAVLFIYFIWTGSENGLDLHFLYVYPIIICFLLGHREGLLWMIAFLSITIFLFFIPELFNNHYYETQLTARFISSYVLISLFAYIIEGLRKTFYIRLQEKKAELERSLNEIQTLSGLLPICSSCKKIRDDKGYWGQLESYITKHSEAQFSHSICPECHAKIKIELTSSKKNKTNAE